MSHFFVAAILPEDIGLVDIEDHIARVMAPYNEELTVAPYEEECWCVSHMVSMYVRNKMKEVFPDGVDGFRSSFKAISEEINSRYPDVPGEFEEWPMKRGAPGYKELAERFHARENEISAAWQKHLAPWVDAEASFELEAIENGERKADPTCGFYTQDFLDRNRERYPNVKVGDRYTDGSGCGGTGKSVSTYNPKSQWDWYVIGGRWDGAIKGLEEIDDGEGGFNFGDQFHTLERNLTKMKYADDDAPYAYLTPDGEWHGRGKMGWWGMSSGDEERNVWKEQWANVRKEYAHHLVVGLDCHI